MISAFGSKFIDAIDSEPKIAVMQMTPQMKDNHLICGLDRVLIKIIKSWRRSDVIKWRKNLSLFLLLRTINRGY